MNIYRFKAFGKKLMVMTMAAAVLLGSAPLCGSLRADAVQTDKPEQTAQPSQSNQTKLIAFTFDDGPSIYTPELLEGLKKRGAEATFFMNGRNGSGGIANYKKLLPKMIRDGHQLANHTYAHGNIGGMSGSEVANEEGMVEKMLFEAMGGSYIDMLRTPGGAYNSTIKESVKSPVILWSLDTRDWEHRDENYVYNSIIQNAGDGSIVLMHDLYKTSVDAALRAVDELKKKGYEFVTVAELMRRRGVTLTDGETYTNAAGTATLPAYKAPEVKTVQNIDDGTLSVQMTGDTGVTLYYTTNGKYPTMADKKYTGAIALREKTAFIVAGYDKFGTRTPAARVIMTPSALKKPEIKRKKDGRVILSSPDKNARIYYTTDGSSPVNNGNLYMGPFVPDSNEIRCVAEVRDEAPSLVSTFYLNEYGDVFSDVKPDSWYSEAVGEAVHLKLMSGTGKNSFSPEKILNRATAAQIFYKLENTPLVLGGSSFKDVQSGRWYGDGISWASGKGLVSGFSDGNFKPEGDVTAEQFITMLYRYTEKVKSWDVSCSKASAGNDGFGKIAGYAEDAAAWAADRKLAEGIPDGSFSWGKGISRASAASILTRYMKIYVPDKAEPAEEPAGEPEESDAVKAFKDRCSGIEQLNSAMGLEPAKDFSGYTFQPASGKKFEPAE